MKRENEKNSHIQNSNCYWNLVLKTLIHYRHINSMLNPIKCYIGNPHFYLIHFEKLVNFVFLIMREVWFFQFEFYQIYCLKGFFEK